MCSERMWIIAIRDRVESAGCKRGLVMKRRVYVIGESTNECDTLLRIASCPQEGEEMTGL
jgi:hypothetical protein